MLSPLDRTCFTVIALGSAGDINPLFTIALTLKNQGHNVLFLSTPEIAHRAISAGLAFAPICTAEDLERTLSHPRLWEARAGLGVLWRYLGVPALKPTVKYIEERLLKNPQNQHVVLASALAMGARIAREIHNFHLVSAYTSPANLRQIEGPFYIGDVAIPTWLPKVFKKQLWKTLDRYKLDPMMRKGLEHVRNQYHLPPLEGAYLEKWMHSPDTGIALWPSWFDSVKHLGQYQAQIQTGFIFPDDATIHDDPILEPLPQLIEQFLHNGPAPLVWMPGSAVRNPELFFHHAIEVSRSLGMRSLFLTSDTKFHSSAPDTGYLAHPLVPFSKLLPRSVALIHHGGIGSAAAAIRAGIPQLIIASAFDQFFNGHRIEALGLGVWCKQKSANPTIIHNKLKQVLGLPQFNIKHYQSELLNINNAQLTCDLLQSTNLLTLCNTESKY